MYFERIDADVHYQITLPVQKLFHYCVDTSSKVERMAPVILYFALYSQINPQDNLVLCLNLYCMCMCVYFLLNHILKIQTVQTRQTHIQLLTKIAIETEIYLPSSVTRGLYILSDTH